jgi:hypothetical protein
LIQAIQQTYGDEEGWDPMGKFQRFTIVDATSFKIQAAVFCDLYLKSQGKERAEVLDEELIKEVGRKIERNTEFYNNHNIYSKTNKIWLDYVSVMGSAVNKPSPRINKVQVKGTQEYKDTEKELGNPQREERYQERRDRNHKGIYCFVCGSNHEFSQCDLYLEPMRSVGSSSLHNTGGDTTVNPKTEIVETLVPG